MIIAIDGPAGSGKGTLAKALSEKLNLVNIDTGATYRCVALKVLQNDIKLTYDIVEKDIAHTYNSLHNEILQNMSKLSGKIILDCHNICNLPKTYHI